jgi:hypothetical protein
MGLFSMVYYDPWQSFGITSELFSGYTFSLLGHVFGEQRGGAAEILSPIGVDHGNKTSSTHPQLGLGPILIY